MDADVLLGGEVLAGGEAGLFFEHAGEVLGVFKAEAVGYLRYAAGGFQFVFGQADDVVAYHVAGGVAGGAFHHVAEIIGRHAEVSGEVVHAGQAFLELHAPVEVFGEQGVETHQHVGVLCAAHAELAVVETPAIVEHDGDVAYQYVFLQMVAGGHCLGLYVEHERGYDAALLLRHVERFVDAVVEE